MSLNWLRPKPPPAATATVSAEVPLTKEALAAEMRLVEASIVQGNVQEALRRVETLMRTNPDEPEVLAHLGICRHLLGGLRESLQPLDRAIQLEPNNVRALYFLAGSLASLNEMQLAAILTRRALDLAPNDLKLLILAGTISGKLGNAEDSARFLNRAHEVAPDDIAPFHVLEILAQQTLRSSSTYDRSPNIAAARRRVTNRLLAGYRRGKLGSDDLTTLISLLNRSREHYATAVEIARSSVNFEPMGTPLAQQLFLTLWSAGDTALALRFSELCYERDPYRSGYQQALCGSWLATGSEHWNSAWRVLTESFRENRPDQHLQTVPMWSGQKLGKKRLLVHQDQGHGDTMICLRFLETLAARGVHFDLWVLPPMKKLASWAKGYDQLLPAEGRPDPVALGYDFVLPMFGPIPALYLQPEEIRTPPVIVPPPDYASELRQRVASLPRPRMGLVYGGNPDRRDDWLRSLALDELRGLANIPGINWVNLSVDDRPDKADAIAMFRMTDPMAGVRDFADTAAIIAELDAVVAVDCSVAHLAGLLGKPLWALVPPSIEWRWQIGDDVRPWWPTARLLRGEAPGVWTAALRQLETDVTQFVGSLRGG